MNAMYYAKKYILLVIHLYIYCREAFGEYSDIQIAIYYEINLKIFYIYFFFWIFLFGFSLFWHFLVITFQLFILHVWLRITDEGSVPEMRIWSISSIESD